MAEKRQGLLLGWVFSMIMALALLIGAVVAYGLIRAGYERQFERRLGSYAVRMAAAFNARVFDEIRDGDEAPLVRYRDRLISMRDAGEVQSAAIIARDGAVIIETPGGVTAGPFDQAVIERSFVEGSATGPEFHAKSRVYRHGFAPIRDREDGAPGGYAVAVVFEIDYLDQLGYVRLSMALTVIGVFVVTLGAALLLTRAWNSLQRDLARQTRLAEQAQFSAGMAHQIKNPLAALRGYIELLSRQLDDPGQKSIADKLVSEVGALDRVVRDFLQFSRGAHGSVERLPLDQALRPVLEAARIAGGDDVAVEADLPSFEVEVDTTALREALTNVAVNAAEALKEQGGKVRVTAHQAGRLVTVEVEDDGPGMPDDIRTNLFRPFVTGKADGTGLGLPIARRLLRDLGGDLELVRTSESGTLFRASFYGDDEALRRKSTIITRRRLNAKRPG